MAEESDYPQQYVSDPLARLQNLEEKQRILKDRILIMGKNLVDEREETAEELKELKKEVVAMKEENNRLKAIIQNLTTQINRTARQEELAIIKRQLDILRK